MSAAALVALTLALAGCETARIPLPKAVAVKSQDEAGTVLVAATMVAPWDEVAPTLAPGFALTGQTALTSAIPDTEQVSQSMLNATSFGLGIGNPANAGAAAATAIPATGPTAGGVATGLPTSPPAAAANTSLGMDQILRYKAADEVNQSVQLLNAEVSYAAIRDCFVPYVVKLRLAFIPYVNPLAYSAHTQISFLRGNGPPPSPATLALLPSDCADPTSEVPVVVPMLVADDLQAALNSRSAETAKQIAVAAAIATHGVGANANAANLSETLTAISNQELSSSLTVSRTTNNGLYVLIAPNNQASGQPALIGQTYDVAVLLLIPRAYFVDEGARPQKAHLSLVTYTKFRDAWTGEVLQPRSLKAFSRQVDVALDPFLLSESDRRTLHHMDVSLKARMVGGLVAAIQTADYPAFEKALNTACPTAEVRPSGWFCVPAGYGPALWAVLTSLTLDSPFRSADFEASAPASIYVPDQSVLVQDDKSGTVSIVLRGVAGSSSATLAGELKLTGASVGGKPGVSVNLPAQSISIDPSSHTLALTFASPIKAGLPDKPGIVPLDTASPETIVVKNLCALRTPRASPGRFCPDVQSGTITATLEEIDKVAPAPGFTLASTGHGIVIGAGAAGTLPLTFSGLGQAAAAGNRPAAATATLVVSGASVTSLTGPAGAVAPTTKGYAISQNGAYTLTFADLTPGMMITVKASGSAAKTTGANAAPVPSFGDDTRTFTTIAGASGAASKGS